MSWVYTTCIYLPRHHRRTNNTANEVQLYASGQHATAGSILNGPYSTGLPKIAKRGGRVTWHNNNNIIITTFIDSLVFRHSIDSLFAFRPSFMYTFILLLLCKYKCHMHVLLLCLYVYFYSGIFIDVSMYCVYVWQFIYVSMYLYVFFMYACIIM